VASQCPDITPVWPAPVILLQRSWNNKRQYPTTDYSLPLTLNSFT